MPDEPLRVTPCPHCGVEMTEARSVCPSCGALLGGVWPPAVTAGPPEAEPARTRLLTGRIWLDEMFGWGLCLLLMAGLGKAASLLESAYLAYVVRLPLSQKWPPFTLPGLGLGAFALTAFAGTYMGIRHFFPKIARSFGQSALFGVGIIVVISLWLELFP